MFLSRENVCVEIDSRANKTFGSFISVGLQLFYHATCFSYHLLWYFPTKQAYDRFQFTNFMNLEIVDFRRLDVPVEFDSQL